MLVFLLGSGVSRPAEMPCVREITEVVIGGVRDGRPYRKSTDESYSNSPMVLGCEPVTVLDFIREIQKRCTRYFSRKIDYEDIAYVVWQVHDQQSGNYENPALVPLIRQVRRRFTGTPLIDLASETHTYIHCVVRDMLSKAPASLGNMPCLIDAFRKDMFDHVDVFTLNHDTMLEQEFRSAAVDFTDGFELRTETCTYWDTQSFANPRHKVRLGKLHGSVDWHLYKPDPGNPTRQMVGKPQGCDFWHTCDFSGKIQWPIGGDSVMLVGSFNKILDYTGGIFADLFCAFRSALRDTKHLVVSGYGFRDKGVNHSIIEWLRASSDRKLVVVHKDYLTFKHDARIAVRKLFETNSSQIIGIGTWFENTSLDDLLSRLFD